MSNLVSWVHWRESWALFAGVHRDGQLQMRGFPPVRSQSRRATPQAPITCVTPKDVHRHSLSAVPTEALSTDGSRTQSSSSRQKTSTNSQSGNIDLRTRPNAARRLELPPRGNDVPYCRRSHMAAGNQQRQTGASVSAIYSGGSRCILHSLPVPNSEHEPLLGLEPTIG